MDHRSRPRSDEERFRQRIQRYARALAEPHGIEALAEGAHADAPTCATTPSAHQTPTDACKLDLGPELVSWHADGSATPTSEALLAAETLRRDRLRKWLIAAAIDPALCAVVPQSAEDVAARLASLDDIEEEPMPRYTDHPTLDMHGNRIGRPARDDRPPPDRVVSEPSSPAVTDPVPRSTRAIALVHDGDLHGALRSLDDGALTPGELLLKSDIEAELGRRDDALGSAARAVAIEVEVPGGTERVARGVEALAHPVDDAPLLPPTLLVTHEGTSRVVCFGSHAVIGRGGVFGLSTPVVSREHLAITLAEGAVEIRDLRSTHGTEVETEAGARIRLTRQLLEDDAVLWLGKEVRIVVRKTSATTVDVALPSATVTLALASTLRLDTIALTYARGRLHFRSPVPLHRPRCPVASEGPLAPPYELRSAPDGAPLVVIDRVRD